MKPRLLVAAIIWGVAPALMPVPCSAQVTSDDSTTGMARMRFKEGVEFFDKSEFEQARASFLQAYALKKHPAVLINLAWSCLKSGHPVEAEGYFVQFLSEGKDISDKQRSEANEGLNQTRSKVGRIEVVAIAGTEISVDGQRVGTTPLAEAVAVEAGAHAVRVKFPDGNTDSQNVSVAGGEKSAAHFARTAPFTPAPAPSTTASPEAPTALAQANQAVDATNTVSTPSAQEAPLVPTSGAGAHVAKSLFPKQMAPVYVGAGIAVVATGVAVVMYSLRQAAQENATATQSHIDAAYKATNATPGPNGCTPTGGTGSPSDPAGVTAACSTLADDNDLVNTDALIGNIALGVAAAALVGSALYWVLADKDDVQSASVKWVPLVGPSFGGLSLSGTF